MHVEVLLGVLLLNVLHASGHLPLKVSGNLTCGGVPVSTGFVSLINDKFWFLDELLTVGHLNNKGEFYLYIDSRDEAYDALLVIEHNCHVTKFIRGMNGAVKYTEIRIARGKSYSPQLEIRKDIELTEYRSKFKRRKTNCIDNGRQEMTQNFNLRNEQDINLSQGIVKYLYQGDIAVNHRQKRGVIRQKFRKWKLPLPYAFDANFPRKSRQRVREAMRFWMDKTCITFQENPYVYPHVNIFEGSGCWSFVGKQPSLREQSLSLEASCIDHLFVVAHELAHALGFYHEHARSDRDDFIQIDYSNIHPNLTTAFAKENEKYITRMNTSYEYGSVMHYSADQFATDPNRPVIYAKNRNYEQAMGNRMRVTFYDITRMNTLYNCHERCANTVNRCLYGGYPAPHDCSQCVCPDGFGGNYCESFELPSIGQKSNPDCGGTLWASNEKSIEIRIKSIISPCSMTCSFNALELKLNNFHMTGYRFCCDEHIYVANTQKPKVFVSDGNLAVIGAYARYDYLEFNIEYRAV
ncbi:unnamed protein product [Caenorhabditis bovis]|uniref:Metalloendopeptidase n=1 Tax=Caenorhabditis bovis TaxID=2654633 RepID=A0A8S1EUF1_9PELO|nr:unnamed protein product [Caenorhabditis bovis]